MSQIIPSHIAAAFETAKQEFLKTLKNPRDYSFDQFKTVDDVYDYTDKLQNEQHVSGNMRYLRRIRPYLENLNQFVGVIDTFSQVKPDMICLIWGPIKFILQISSTLTKSYDKVIDAMGQIGDRLPQFKRFVEMFQSNDNLKSVLAMFFRDILDFHVTALNFFKSKTMWPRCAEKVNIIMANIIRHASLITNEVTLASITEARQAHEAALEKYKRDYQWQQRHDLDTLRQMISPMLYDDQLEKFRRIGGVDSGLWLDQCAEFNSWRDPNNLNDRLLWIEGIPGAGKTVLVSSVIERMRATSGITTAFVFLTYKDQSMTYLKTLHSLLFQLVYDLPDLRPILLQKAETNQRAAISSTAFNENLLEEFIQMVGPVNLVIDGLDELVMAERRDLLQAMLRLLGHCGQMKLLVSSRSEVDIAWMLKQHPMLSLKLHHMNHGDVESFINKTAVSWLDSRGFDSHISAEIRRLIQPLAAKSDGMMLYAKLIMDSLTYLSSLSDIKQELNTLPDGLDQAYGRILKHVTENLPKNSRSMVRRILSWIAGAEVPLRLRELEDAMSITYTDIEFNVERRVILKDVTRLCGPIVEISEGCVQFVHFSAKQYLTGEQSNGYVDIARTHLDMSRTCLAYLSFKCIDESDTDEIVYHVLEGDYTFHYYSATQWMKHVQHYAQNPTTPEDTQVLCQELEQFFVGKQYRELLDFQASRLPPMNRFKAFMPQWSTVCRTLLQEEDLWMHHLSLVGLNDASTDDGAASSASESVLTLFTTYARTFTMTQSILCQGKRHWDNCPCQQMRLLYGTCFYKCDRIACWSHRHGFQTYDELEIHIRNHVRDSKCSDNECQFHVIGFKTDGDLRKHVDKCHPVTPNYLPPRITTSKDDKDALKAVLKQAVLEGDASTVSQLLSQHEEDWTDLTSIFTLAIADSTLEIIQILLDRGYMKHEGKLTDRCNKPGFCYNVSIYNIIHDANTKVMPFLLDRLKGRGLEPSHFYLARSRHRTPQEILDIIGAILMIKPDIKTRGLRIDDILRPTQEDSDSLLKSIELLRDAGVKIGRMDGSLAKIANKSCSVPVAQILLQEGASIDYQSNTQRPALFIASRRTDEKAALFAKFLLEQGADPELDYDGEYSRDQKGAQQIQRWLGMSWDELVESTSEARKVKTGQIVAEGSS